MKAWKSYPSSILRSIILSSISLIFFSCSSYHEEEISEEYTFIKIVYEAYDGSVGDVLDKFTPTSYVNETSSDLVISYNRDPLSDKSLFSSMDSKAFDINDIYVSVPLYIDQQNIVSLDSRKWKYSKHLEEQKSNLIFSENIVIPARMKVTINTQLSLRKYVVNYQLHLENKKDKSIKIIKGEWTGIFPDKHVVTHTFSDI